jgi:hypothetical protein
MFTRTSSHARTCVRYAVLLMIGMALFCQAIPAGAQDSQKELSEKLAKSQIRTAEYWGTDWKNRPLAQRLASAPQPLVDYILMDNQLNGFEERPSAAGPTAVFQRVLAGLLDELTPPVRALAEKNIIGVFLVSDLGGTGYTESVQESDGKIRQAFIVLDRDLLMRRQANDWASWKENSFFAKDESNIRVSLTIEEKNRDSIENAIRYILLHELGHALAVAGCMHPSWNDPLDQKVSNFAFVGLGWEWKDDRLASKYLNLFPDQPLVHAYGFDQSGLPRGRAPEIYECLARTSYPSLQASTSVFEDFAETFATYQHVVRAGRPWRVEIKSSGDKIATMESPWHDKRLNERRTFMKNWFAGHFGCPD